MVPDIVLQAYGFGDAVVIQPYGSGHIHKTFVVDDRGKRYVLQRINHYVFRFPELIVQNIQRASQYLKENHPDYYFLSILKTRNGDDMVYDPEGHPWRLLPFVENTITLNEIRSSDEAFEAAKGFAALTRNLAGIDLQSFSTTIDRFHDLSWRYRQFEDARLGASPDRLQQAALEIERCKHHTHLVDQYTAWVTSRTLTVRITHNDTKVNNILFDKNSLKSVCVIDLDTLMPGYFIYDLGDMVRTFVGPVSEEESDLSKIVFRKEIYDALLRGYLSEMNTELSEEEKKAVPFSGLMMTYIMALRFLTDYLNGDVYFSTTYPGQNLNRAKNQLKLLEVLSQNVR